MFIAKLSESTIPVFSITFIVKNVSSSLTYTVATSCVCTSPLAVMTTVGLHDFVKVSISPEFKSFLLNMCIDAPGSTTNSCSHSGISESPHGFHRSFVVSFLLGFEISLAWISSGSSTNSDTGTGEMSLLVASSFFRTEISSTIVEEGEDEEDEEE